MQLNFKPDLPKIAKILGIVALTIAVLSLITEYLVVIVFAAVEQSIVLDMLDLFSVNLEDSIPTWYSVLILFVASVLLFVISNGKSQSNDAYARHWWGLAFVFLYLSMDEGAVIHEIFSEPLQVVFNTDGFLTFGWLILAFPIVIIFGLIYLRFLFHLPPKTRNFFILSAVLYTGGALIIEGFSASQYDEGNLTMTYLGLATIEEFLEILGVSCFIFALLDYMQQQDYKLSISIKEKHVPSGEEVVSNLVQSHSSGDKSTILLNPMILLIIFLILLNSASFAWILGNRPRNLTLDAPAFYEAKRAELESASVTILEAPDTFGIENTHSLPIVRSLSTTNNEIYVVAFPSDSHSVIFAGDNIPFDRDTLVEWLHNSGRIEFIIFDTASIDVMLDN